MIDLSWSHILIVVIVALVVIGPKDLPRFMHMAGRWMSRARAMADQFRKSFDEMSRQTELDELRKEIAALREQRPLAEVQDTLGQPILPPDMISEPSGELQAPESGAPEPAETEPASKP
jgi:sec-independent protein translocase protein TatB